MAAPGQPFRIGLRLQHDPHWHTYWRNPGDSGLPTRFDPIGPEGAAYTDIVWPAPRRLAIGDLANYGYEGEVLVSREVTLPASFEGSTAHFEVLAQWLVCKDVCIPGEASLALELPVGPQARVAVLNALGGRDHVKFIALLVQGIPRSVKVDPSLARSDVALAPLELDAVNFGDAQARIPDLVALEQKLADAGLI